MIVDKCRDKNEFITLYKSGEYDRLAKPEEILALSTYRCFYDDKGVLVGCIYLEDEDNKVMLSGFGRRKSFDLIVEAIKFILNLNANLDIYSRTTKLNAKYALRHAGFEKLNNELYIRKAVINGAL